MKTEEKEVKTDAASQTADDYQTGKLADLPVAAEQTEEVRGGRGAVCQNNLKQMSIG
jgi:hypothetical protein